MSEAYLEYLFETESDENVIWSAVEKFKGYLLNSEDLTEKEED